MIKCGFWAFAKSYFKDKTVKNISFKMAKARMAERLFLDILDTFWIPLKKCPFCPLRVVNFKTRNSKHPKIGFVTIMLSKRIFDPKKL